MNEDKMENEICIDYEKSYKDLQKEFAKLKEQHREELNEKDLFYKSLLDKDDAEIKWLKSVIDSLIRR